MAMGAQPPATNTDAERHGLAAIGNRPYSTLSIWPDNVAATPRHRRAHDQCLTNIVLRRRAASPQRASVAIRVLRESKPIDGSQMKAFRDPTFSDRLGSSSAAKKAALDRFRAKAEDPAVAELRAARAAAAAERELRAAERAEARRIEQERQAAQKAADEIAARAEREARQIREADEMLVLEAQRKAERDARYAARKARKAG
jgi:hypothetical protein